MVSENMKQPIRIDFTMVSMPSVRTIAKTAKQLRKIELKKEKHEVM
jgi:hypothetical protein